MKKTCFLFSLIILLGLQVSSSQILLLKGYVDIKPINLLDIDGDGIPEIMADTNAFYDGKTLTLKYKLTGKWLPNDDYWPAMNPFLRYPLQDYNGDGKIDVFSWTGYPGLASFSILDVSTGRTLFNIINTSYQAVLDVFLADIDGDNKLELLVVFAGGTPTYRTFIYSTSLSTTSVKSQTELSQLPYNYVLKQNYPNPFNPTTSIEYDIQTKSKATIKIYNSLGQHIRTILDEEKMPGTYTIKWDGKDVNGLSVATGVYYYQLYAGEFASSKKMLLIK